MIKGVWIYETCHGWIILPWHPISLGNLIYYNTSRDQHHRDFFVETIGR